jgi:hypothetical protein
MYKVADNYKGRKMAFGARTIDLSAATEADLKWLYDQNSPAVLYVESGDNTDDNDNNAANHQTMVETSDAIATQQVHKAKTEKKPNQLG